MNRRVCSSWMLFCAAMGMAPAVADASFESLAAGSATGPGSISQLSTQPSCALASESINTTGGHGYGQTNLDFIGGVVTGRAHGCVGPASPLFRDTATGMSRSAVSSEMIDARSSTLANGAPLSMTLCYSITSDVYGTATVPSLVSSGFASNTFSMIVNGSTAFSGAHSIVYTTQEVTSTGNFAGTSTGSRTISGMFTFTVFNGVPFPITMSVISRANASSMTAPGEFPIVDGSSGYAFTFGLTSASVPDLSLKWRNPSGTVVDWIGNCGDSSGLVPPNPVPAAPTLATLLALAPMLYQRRRTRG